MVLLRQLLGDTLRAQRLSQQRTLREVSDAARVSLGYLSEVERGQKEASSELIGSICEALGVPLSDVLRNVTDTLSAVEQIPDGVPERVGPDGAGVDGSAMAETESADAQLMSGRTPVSPVKRLSTARIVAPPRSPGVTCSTDRIPAGV